MTYNWLDCFMLCGPAGLPRCASCNHRFAAHNHSCLNSIRDTEYIGSRKFCECLEFVPIENNDQDVAQYSIRESILRNSSTTIESFKNGTLKPNNTTGVNMGDESNTLNFTYPLPITSACANMTEAITPEMTAPRTKPIIAYRAWTRKELQLFSSVSTTIAWPFREKLESTCAVTKHDGPTPFMDCTCGIHGFKKEKDMASSGFQHSGIVGRVALWGKIDEHENGYRAQYAYPQVLYLLGPKGSEENAIIRLIADEYAIECVFATDDFKKEMQYIPAVQLYTMVPGPVSVPMVFGGYNQPTWIDAKGVIHPGEYNLALAARISL